MNFVFGCVEKPLKFRWNFVVFFWFKYWFWSWGGQGCVEKLFFGALKKRWKTVEFCWIFVCCILLVLLVIFCVFLMSLCLFGGFSGIRWLGSRFLGSELWDHILGIWFFGIKLSGSDFLGSDYFGSELIFWVLGLESVFEEIRGSLGSQNSRFPLHNRLKLVPSMCV